MRRQIVLDRASNKLLEELTADRDGNYSRTVRQALQALADQEKMFEAIERDSGFIAMMERSEAEFRAGKGIPHEQVVRELRAARKKKK